MEGDRSQNDACVVACGPARVLRFGGRFGGELALLLVMTCMGGHSAVDGAEVSDVHVQTRNEMMGFTPGEYRHLHERDDRLIIELPNRLLVVVQELKAAPVVSAQVWVKTGSIYEIAAGGSGAGLSHFLEHLVSGGTTETRSESDSNAILGSIGGKTNAATSLATVRYYINTTSRHAGEAIELLSDWLQNSSIVESEFQRERDVIQREFQMGQGEPGRIFWKLTQKARYRYHPARHPTIGYLDEFLNVSREELYDFYRRLYVPNNMVFVVVGDIDKQEVVDRIARLWNGVKPGQTPAIQFPVEPEISEPVTLSGSADVRRPRLRLAWPGTRLGQEGDYALDLLGVVLGQGESSRLVRIVRDEKRLVNTIDAFNLSMSWGDGFFGVDAEIAPDDAGGTDDEALELAKSAILDQITRVRQELITSEELERAKRKTRARAVFSSQTAQGLAADLAENIISMRDPDYTDHYVEAVQSITREEVQDAARKFLEPVRLITVKLLPLSEGSPPANLTRPEEERPPDGLATERIELDNASVSEQILSRSRSDASRSIQTDPVELKILSNGLRLLIGRDTAVPAVAMQFYQLGGLLADAPGREGIAHAAARMQIKGTRSRDAESIARQIENLGASMGTTSGYNSQYAQALCLTEDWPTILELLADVILNPAYEQGEWQKMQPRLLASIDRLQDRWTGELGTRFRTAYFAHHPWSTTPLGRRDVVEGLTVDDLRHFHGGHLGASESVLAVFGDVDPDEVIRQAESLFAALPQHPVVAFQKPDPAEPVPGLNQFTTSKPLAAVQIGYGPGATRQSPDYPVLRVLSNVVSDFPSGWLHQALRGREGLAYAAWAYAYTGLSPGFFAVVFNTKPQTVAESLSRSLQIVERVRSEQVDERELARAKAGVLTTEFFGKQSNGDRAQEAALAELYGMGLDESARFLHRVEGVTSEELRAVARKYLNNPVVVVISHEPTPDEQLKGILNRSPIEEAGE